MTSLAEGDRVLVPAITSCGRCAYCKRAMPSHCQAVGGIGWIFGHLIDGTQAEYARVPFAETSVHKVPEGVTDEQVLFLADILPTGYEVGVRNGRVKPGDVVVVVGAGPVGLAAIQTASLAGAASIIALDLAESRLEHALRFGADTTINAADPNAEERIAALTDGGLGADVAIEAVGTPGTFDVCTRVVRPGGVIANIGVHGAPTTLHLEELWIKNVTITTGLVDGTTVPLLLQLVRSGKIAAEMYGTRPPLSNRSKRRMSATGEPSLTTRLTADCRSIPRCVRTSRITRSASHTAPARSSADAGPKGSCSRESTRA